MKSVIIIICVFLVSSVCSQDFEDKIVNPLLDTCRVKYGIDMEEEARKLSNCVTNEIDIAAIGKKVEKAINESRGGLNDIFEEYCGTRKGIMKCLVTFTDSLKSCSNNFSRIIDTVMDTVDAAWEYLCYENGNRMALFIFEDGLQCVQSNAKQMSECTADIMSQYQAVSTEAEEFLRLFNTSKEACEESFELRDCVVKAFQKCSRPTPGDLVEGLLQVVLKASPCKQYMHISAASFLKPWFWMFLTISLTVLFL